MTARGATRSLADLERDVARLDFAVGGVMPFGSWAVGVRATRRGLLDDLAFLYRQSLADIAAARPRGPTPRLYLLHAGAVPALERFARARLPAAIPEDECVEHAAGGVTVIGSALILLIIVAGRRAPRMYLVARERDRVPAFRAHLALIVNTLLFHFDRLFLHAGAVSLHGRVHVFVGERGAGKTTACLRLATAGATVLSDDHVVLRRTPRGFRVSGAGDRARVTEETERYLLPVPLDAEPTDFGGCRKKEFRVAEHFASRPFRDHRARAVYFLTWGSAFTLDAMPRGQALFELMSRTRGTLRFGDPARIGRFLDFWTGFLAGVQPFALALTPRLADLDRLVDAVAGDTSVATAAR